jgi:hypothetical protein
MSENANPELPAGNEPASTVGDEAPAPKRKPKRKLRLRDMQSAVQNGGWLWIEKDAVDRVLLNTGGVEAGLIYSTYAALCRLSSDRGNATSVTAGMGVIAKQAGCSRRTVIRALKELERVKLIAVRRIRRGNRNDENTYFLLACSSRRGAKKVVSEKHNGSDGPSSGVVTENSEFSGTELKEESNFKSYSHSIKAKTPMAAAAFADAQQQPGRFANEDGRKVRGLGSW